MAAALDDPVEAPARPEFAALSQWIAETPAAELERRQQSAENAFRQLGITFAVYGDSDAAERIIPFDIVPRIFSAAEWERLSAGLEQRVRAINAFIDDVYGARKILADGIVPADIVRERTLLRQKRCPRNSPTCTGDSLALDVAVVLGAVGGAATCGAVLVLFVGALRDSTVAAVLFSLFGVAVGCALGAIVAFTAEMLMASIGIRTEVAEGRRTATENDVPEAAESQHDEGVAGGASQPSDGG